MKWELILSPNNINFLEVKLSNPIRNTFELSCHSHHNFLYFNNENRQVERVEMEAFKSG
jgi:hypothetical protein